MASSGRVQIANQTQFIDNIAGDGSAIYIIWALAIYMLPAPPGHYMPAASPCDVTYVQCPGSCRECYGTNEKLTPALDMSGCGNRPPYLYQKCPWSRTITGPDAFGPSIIGQTLMQLVPGAHNFSRLPFPCNAGLRGANASSNTGQSTPLCEGICNAGFYCPTPATLEPRACPPGHACPAGTVWPVKCKGGTYSNTTKLKSVTDCASCPMGHKCSKGTAVPVACEKGSVAVLGRSECIACPEGRYQGEKAQTACFAALALAGCGDVTENVRDTEDSDPDTLSYMEKLE